MTDPDLLQQLAGQLPSVTASHDWNPPFSGLLNMRIDRDGRWHYQERLLEREAVVRLFAGILRREQDDYYLVTPVEKFLIRVDEQPFVSQALEIEGEGHHQKVWLLTNTGERLLLGAEHPLIFIQGTCGEMLPCMPVRAGLHMLLQRSHFYQLVEWALAQSDDDALPAIFSAGQRFSLQPESTP